jgi:putative oxidoreductase
MKIAILISRVLLGLVFLVFGLNQFFHFIPMEMPAGEAGDFIMGLVKSRYFIPLLGTFQTLCGISLLTNRFVPLALVILFPINLNILLFHLVLAPDGMITGVVTLGLNIFLMYAYRNQYMHFQQPEAKHSHH